MISRCNLSNRPARIALEKVTSKGGKPYAQYNFEAVSTLSSEETATARAYQSLRSCICEAESYLLGLGIGAAQMPFSPEEAKSGGFTTGKGNSSNIVADSREYQEISRKISDVDDRMGQCLYSVALEIEAMCQSAYKLPWAVPRCLNISNSLKASLGEFRSLTEEATHKMCAYSREITEIE